MEMLSTFFLCSKTFLALPKLERAGLDPTCRLEQGQDLSRKCHVSVKLWNLCVYLEMASSFYLRVSECMCTILCTHVYTQAFPNK